jgi:hypothetical protein
LTDEGRKALEVCERSNGKPASTRTRCTPAVSKALEAEDRREARRRRSREARQRGVRPGTVSARWRDGRRLPDRRMTGRWFEDAGFGLGQEYEVEVEAGKLTIQAI